MAHTDGDRLNRRTLVSLGGAGLAGVLASSADAKPTAPDTVAKDGRQTVTPALPAPNVSDLSRKVDRTANLSDLADSEEAFGNLGFVQSGAGAVRRTARAKAQELVSVADFGATGEGTGDDTAAFVAAAAAHPGKIIHVPAGTYRLGQVGNLNEAGTSFRGAGRYASIIKPAASMRPGQAIFYNGSATEGTSAYGLIEDIGFDLSGQDCICIDLSSCNNFNVNRCHFRGGSNRRSALGTGVRFGSPRNQGAYTNTVTNCSGHALSKGLEFGRGANSCMVVGGEYLNCTVGADAGPDDHLDTPRIIGTRFEGCGVSVRIRALGAQLHAVRFEDSAVADVEFLKGSDRCEIMGGYSASSRVTLLAPENCTNLVCIAGDLGWFETHDGAKYMQGVHVLSGVGQAAAPALPAGVNATAFFTQTAVLFNDVGLEAVNISNDDTLLMLRGNTSNELEILGFDRKLRAYRDVNIGGGESVNPLGTGVTSLGKDSRRFRTANLSEGVRVAGKQVVGAQHPAIDDATDAASTVRQLNAVLECLRAHGLIAK